MTHRPIALINDNFCRQSERLLYEFDILYNNYLEEMNGKWTIKNLKHIYINIKFIIIINFINYFHIFMALIFFLFINII